MLAVQSLGANPSDRMNCRAPTVAKQSQGSHDTMGVGAMGLFRPRNSDQRVRTQSLHQVPVSSQPTRESTLRSAFLLALTV